VTDGVHILFHFNIVLLTQRDIFCQDVLLCFYYGRLLSLELWRRSVWWMSTEVLEESAASTFKCIVT